MCEIGPEMKKIASAILAFGTALSPSTLLAQAAVKAATALPPPPTPLIQNPLIGQPVSGKIGIQPQVTELGQKALWMHDALLTPIIFAISLFVLGLMLWVVARFRRSANPVPSKTTHNTFIEILWTFIPIVILIGIAVPSISLLAAQYKAPSKNAVTIKATGSQWLWSYEYPDHGGFEVVSNMLSETDAKAKGEPYLLGVNNRMFVPVDTEIKMIVTSADVIHSWAMPAFWTKMDTVPGRLNEVTFKVMKGKEGVYYGQCSELCGKDHGFMPIAVEVVSKENFAKWIASKGGTMPGAKPATAPAASPAPAATPAAVPVIAPVAPTPAAANAAAPTK